MALVGIGHKGLDALLGQDAVGSPKGMIGMEAVSREHQGRVVTDDALPEQLEVDTVDQQKH